MRGRARTTLAAALAATVLAGSLAITAHTAILASAAAATGYHSLTPQRLVDTRSGLGVGGPGTTVPSTPVSIAMTGEAANAAAVALNVTVTDAGAAGFATVYPCGAPPPLASNVNFDAGQTVPNAVIAAPGDHGAVCVVTNVAADLVVDLEGWFPVGSYAPLPEPRRVLDTRSDPSLGLRAGVESRLVHVADGAPVVVNVTVTNPRGSGYLVVYPCGAKPPIASNLNFAPGETVANLAVAHPDPNGDVCALSSVATDVIVDLQGEMGDAAGYTAISPVRMVDTRSPIGVPAVARTSPGQVVELAFPEESGIPSVVDSVIVNVTATDAVAGGYVTVYPCGQPPPLASNVNIERGETRPNLVLSAVGADGIICLTTNTATHIVVDLQGWFTSGAPMTPTSPASRQHVDVGPGLAAGYLAYLPPGYASSPGRTWPTIVFLHGSGQTGPGSGAALDGLAVNGLPRLYESGTEPAAATGFIVLAPQMPDGSNSPTRLRTWLSEVLARYGVDRDRVYLTGLSAGGFYAFDYVGAVGDSNEFAAVVPISGGFPHPIQCSSWQHTPIWAFHGEADTTVNPAGSITTIGAIDANCSPIEPLRLTTYPGVGHDAWDPTYDLSGMAAGRTNPQHDPYDVDIYTWMLAHVRSEYR
ncbi:MAG: putative metalloprotease [Ilumatobacteraceae bacterium]|nr:putative metalloprotease [Ilumatobacteraceae bacterium]